MECAYFPIKNITTYTTNWTVLARIIDKSPLKSLKSDNSFLYIDIVDKDGDTIRGKFWGIAATKWNELLQKGCVYKFSKGTVNLANKKFNSTPHNYELTFGSDSLIEPSDDVDNINLERSYQFVTLRDIKSTARETPFVVDLICFAKQIGSISTINTKAGREMKRRTLHVVDDTGYELEMTIWEELCDLPLLDDIVDKPLIVSQVIIKEWNGGRQAQTGMGTDIKIADEQNVKDRDRLSNLVSWYQQALTQNEMFKSMKSQNAVANTSKDSYEFCTISKVLSKTKGNYSFNSKLRRIYWKTKEGVQRLWYQSCPMCLKKVVVGEDNDIFRCISCDDAIVVPVLRYVFTCVFIDYTGQIVCNVYGENGTKLIGTTEQELNSLDAEEMKHTLDFLAIHKDYKVSGFYKTRTYNGETRHLFNVSSIEPIEYVAEAQRLLDEMQISYDAIKKCFDIKIEDSEPDENDSKKPKSDQ